MSSHLAQYSPIFKTLQMEKSIKTKPTTTKNTEDLLVYQVSLCVHNS